MGTDGNKEGKGAATQAEVWGSEPSERLTQMATDTDKSGDGANDTVRPQLSGSLQGHIGRQLRAAYSELVQEPIPDRFSKLLDELAKSQKTKPANASDEE